MEKIHLIASICLIICLLTALFWAGSPKQWRSVCFDGVCLGIAMACGLLTAIYIAVIIVSAVAPH